MPEDKSALMKMVINAYSRSMNTIFGGAFSSSLDMKHTTYQRSYGYPLDSEMGFDLYYARYDRDSIAKAVVDMIVDKCWIDSPIIEFGDNRDNPPEIESEINGYLKKIRFWGKLKEVDRRSRVGDYSAVLLRFADGKRWSEPVDRVPGGIEGLVDVMPAWEGQLKPSDWDSNEMSRTYGEAIMYQFNEQAVDPKKGKNRSFNVHPDRVVIWSRDGTINGRSVLKAIYDDLSDHKKLSGSGAEGNFQASKATPHYNIDPDTNLNQMAVDMGLESAADIPDMFGKISDAERKDFDKAIVTKGVGLAYKQISLNDPTGFAEMTERRIAAGANMSQKAIFGNQNGERASTEDNKRDNATAQARRESYIIPNIESVIERLEKFGVVGSATAWSIEWSDLTELSKEQKLANSKTMSEINKNTMGTGEPVPFTSEQMADNAGFEYVTDSSSGGE